MDKKTKIAVLLTTFNRCNETIKCLKSIYETNELIDFRFVVADDNSSDDTVAELRKLPAKIRLLDGNGNLYWNGGMRMAMAFAKEHAEKFGYVLLINDDVVFKPGAISRLLDRLEKSDADAIVGATSDKDGNMSYGGVRMTSKHFARFEMIEPTVSYEKCDTFNCNCLLMKSSTFKEAGNLDRGYTHSMGDYDYGMHLKKLGMTVISSSEYVGSCEDNDKKGTWKDTSLPRLKRLKLKEGPKGLPFKDWFHFVNKNYGILPALYHSATPYVRIILNK